MKKNSALPTLRAPKGYRFKITEQHGSVYVQLLNKQNREVGHINMYKRYPYNKKPFRLETHSYLHPDLRGKGIGTLLYSKAIEWGLKRGYKVKSSGGSSEDAQRVWNGKGIRKHFTIRRRESRPYGYNQETWYAYEKVSKKDRAKNKRR